MEEENIEENEENSLSKQGPSELPDKIPKELSIAIRDYTEGILKEHETISASRRTAYLGKIKKMVRDHTPPKEAVGEFIESVYPMCKEYFDKLISGSYYKDAQDKQFLDMIDGIKTSIDYEHSILLSKKKNFLEDCFFPEGLPHGLHSTESINFFFELLQEHIKKTFVLLDAYRNSQGWQKEYHEFMESISQLDRNYELIKFERTISFDEILPKFKRRILPAYVLYRENLVLIFAKLRIRIEDFNRK